MAKPSNAEQGPNPSSVAFFRYFLSAYPIRSALMVFMLSVAGLLEGISVITLVPLLEIAADGGSGGDVSGVSVAIQGALEAIGVQATLGSLLVLIIGAITAKAIFLWLAMKQVGYTVAGVTLDLRLQLVRALLRARWRYFGSQPVGQFANAISSEAIRAASAYREACIVMAGVIQVLAYLVVSWLISWEVTIAALVTGTLLFFGLSRFVRMARAAGEQQTQLTKSLTGRLVDAVQGIKPVKAMARERLFWPLLEAEAEGLNRAHRRQVLASESLNLVQEPVVTLVLGVGLVALLTVTDRSFSAIVVLAFVFYRLMMHARTLQMRYQVMSVGESAFWSLRGEIDRATEAAEDHGGERRPRGLEEGLELSNVSFAYGDHQVLRDLSLRVPAGSFVALIGPSGSGKTTILDLVTGLRRPDKGQILVDGTPLDELDLRAWRRLIGYVPQEVFLFHDTVRQNVTLGDESIDDQQVERALRDAGAWEFIAERPEGIDAMIAPQASNLSGGQRQRLAIARALVSDPALLVLDEATTGLDAMTEAGIVDTLEALAGKVTVLAISHQHTLQRAASFVVELEGGRIQRADTVRTT